MTMLYSRRGSRCRRAVAFLGDTLFSGGNLEFEVSNGGGLRREVTEQQISPCLEVLDQRIALALIDE
jgi:hypothetical protein